MKISDESQGLFPDAGLLVADFPAPPVTAVPDARPEIEPDFGEDTFRHILALAQARGYRFATFADYHATGAVPHSRCFFLRHDVDISPGMALRLGEIEHEHGVRGNFFFQFNAETYSFFVPETLGIIRALQGMGHCVGLHIDEQLTGTEEEAIAKTLDWVIDCVLPIDRTISFHRASRGNLGRRYERFLSAYDSRLFDAQSYLSDSRRSFAFYEPLMGWLGEGRPCIQLLLHPEWWGGVNRLDRFWDVLRDRRSEQLRRYMTTNFPKVFDGMLPTDDTNFLI
ncbi:hypothetical protein [Azospirillum rugosum]|uniref:Polysaccharide deacetylase n=1 Tax=Azospirillum rugosum TaxID=416170 RepID=A0ABS4SFD4_9PROT|nr:hypothetical protein [Azospirillum rugosum]MBP2291287.1 hypothetical protein [Azospirillum rugosum]MDQ0525075.1 hypothetical protein [Azospirillum rugosum]